MAELPAIPPRTIKIGEEFKEEAIYYAGLVVIAFLRPKCQYIQLAHSIAKLLHSTTIMDINNKVVGFIGDRNDDLKPYAVVLQDQKACNGKHDLG